MRVGHSLFEGTVMNQKVAYKIPRSVIKFHDGDSMINVIVLFETRQCV